MVKSLAGYVRKEDFVLGSEYLTTLLVVVPAFLQGEWNCKYETLTDLVVPRSSKRLVEEQDYCLFTVTVFRKACDEFKERAKEQKFVVRDFCYDDEELSAEREELKKLGTEMKEQWVIQ